MPKYRIENKVVDTETATKSWDEDTTFDGHNNISVPTGSQWNHETLYRSRRGLYYIVHTSQWQGSRPYAEWVSPEQAAVWLLTNGHEVPEDLKKAAEVVSE